MEKSKQLHQNLRQNADNIQSYMSDLKQWETDMKRKECQLKNVPFEKDLPPVRSKVKKTKVTTAKQPPEARIPSHDYKSWDKFDVDKACEMVDLEGTGPISLDSKLSQNAKEEKLKEEALYEKDQGNKFVKLEKWDEAIKCYSRAIALNKKDPVFYANRAQCHLKKESLHAAIADCTQALQLDPTYIKAYLRRSLAREKLGSLRGASEDLQEVLNLEPNNDRIKQQLDVLKKRMGSKGSKYKSSPVTSPLVDKPVNPFPIPTTPKIVELIDEENNNDITKVNTKEVVKPLVQNEIEKEDTWKNGSGDGLTIVNPINKPPHLRSKKPLKQIEIVEIPIGATVPDIKEDNVKPPTRLKIEEFEEIPEKQLKGQGDIIENNEDNNIDLPSLNGGKAEVCNGDIVSVEARVDTPTESQKLKDEICSKEKSSPRLVVNNNIFEIPTSYVQFISQWKSMKGKFDKRSSFLSAIEAKNIPKIFKNSLESDLFLEILTTMHDGYDFVESKEAQVLPYLLALVQVPRFSTLTMFLSQNEKKVVSELLEHCKAHEGIDEKMIGFLKSKFEV